MMNLERFWSRVQKTDSCWLWIGSKDSDGYGMYHTTGSRPKAHQVTYALLKGNVPTGFEIDHLCRNRACVNPDHLEAVTHRTNVLRGESPASKHAVKTHCHRGHPFSPENTYLNPKGGRECRACNRIATKAYYARSIA